MRHLSILVLILACATPAVAQDSLMGKPFPPLRAGEWINARNAPTLEGLRGRPVLVAYWGLKCTVCHCRDVLKKLVGVDKKYRNKGLCVIGMHMHQATAAQIDVFSLKYGITFPMGHAAQFTAFHIEQIPQLFLLDTEGKVIWEGHAVGGDFTRQLSGVLRQVDFMGEASLPPSLSGVKRLVARRQLGKAIADLIDFAADPNTLQQEREAAKAFQGKLEQLGEREYLRASSALRMKDCYRGIPILETLAGEYKGQPLGRKAASRLKEALADAELAEAREIGDLYRKLRLYLARKNERGAGAVAGALVQKYADSPYARIARGLLEAWDTVD